MPHIEEIFNKTVENLKKNNIEISPKNYMEEFCKISKTIGYENKDCEFFILSLLELSDEELSGYGDNEINNIYDLVKVLLKRPSSKDLSNTTSEVNTIINHMNEQIKDSISTHTKVYSNVHNIKNDIEKADTNKELLKIKDKLLNATNLFENEIISVNNNLNNRINEIEILSNKIKQLEDEFNKYKEESSIDFLTSLLTRKAYEYEVQKFEDLYIRDNNNYALVFFDIDDFKYVNDTYGHDCGDIILKTFSQILKKLTRKTDLLARYGGEEFICIIKYKNEDELAHYLSRVKKVVTTNKFIYKNLKLDITFSAGVEIRSSNNDYDSTFKKADDLLYEAKNSGKNKIILSSGLVI